MTTEADSSAEPRAKPTFLQSLATFGERRTLVMLVLGFSAGLPNLLVFDTLSIWLRDAGLSLATISIFGLATLATAMKFLWAPLVDRTRVPFLTTLFGHRRSWMLVSQAVIMLGLCLIAGVNPATNLGLMALFAVMVGFASANQDIVIDAWRIEAADDARQGPMAAAYQWGYRIAMIVAGAVPLILAEAYSWNLSYAAMAALMLVGVAAVFAAPREAAHSVRPIDVGDTPRRPAAEAVEWTVRLVVLVSGGLLVGSGLAASVTFLADILTGLGAGALGETLTTAWANIRTNGRAVPNTVTEPKWVDAAGASRGFEWRCTGISPVVQRGAAENTVHWQFHGLEAWAAWLYSGGTWVPGNIP
jgi:PAT family beta-lactamase induction signal transducer AmpG